MDQRPPVPPRRVLYVHHRSELGGAPTSLSYLISNLGDEFEPHVYCPPGRANELFSSVCRGRRWLLFLRGLMWLPEHVVKYRCLLKQHSFDLVYLNVVWHLRSPLSGDGRDLRSALITHLNRWGVVAIDDGVAARFRLNLPLAIVHNRVPLVARRPLDGDRASLGLPQDRITVGFAGFVRHQKGWPQLVEAAALLVREGVPVHFAIMGGGVRSPAFFRTLRGRGLAATNVLEDEETAIRKLVRTKGLEDAFSFLPFTVNTAEVYSALHLLTFPNQGIGLGRPVLEAAMHGKPVVASGSESGAGVLLPERTDILVADPTPRNLADAIRRLMGDSELRKQMGATASEHAVARFNATSNARAVEQIYDALLGTNVEADPESRTAAAA
jgi:glycosyltransferase involved in cell wall biosynthesis